MRLGTRLGCLEMILGGTTTFVDMYYFEDAIADEISKAGMRGVLGETVIDFPRRTTKPGPTPSRNATSTCASGKTTPLITPAIAPHAPYTVSADHLKEAYAFALKYDVPLLIHWRKLKRRCSKFASSTSGLTPVAYLDKLGVLDKRVLARALDLRQRRRHRDAGQGAAWGRPIARSRT